MRWEDNQKSNKNSFQKLAKEVFQKEEDGQLYDMLLEGVMRWEQRIGHWTWGKCSPW